MRITSKGQVTIPAPIRERLGFLPHSEVEFEVVADWVRIRKISDSQRRGLAYVESLRGRARTGLTTEDILRHARREQP
ncbi:MAG: AbrB/MazE/SpoVT family DNA-binding domain-containing protein [Gemmatimonadota bacterium]